MGQPGYIHLTAKSNFSLLEVLPSLKKLAKSAAEMGFPALGVTELGNVFSAVEVSKKLAEVGVQPILGCELPVIGEARELGAPVPRGMLTLLVQNETGWKNLAALVSAAEQRKMTEAEAGVPLDAVVARQAGLICLSGAYGRGWFAQGEIAAQLEPLRVAFGDRFFVQLQRHGEAGEPATETLLLAYARAHKVPLVATNDSRFVKPSDLQAFEVLVGIGDGTTLDDPNRRRFTPNHALRSEAEMLALFADLPSACANTVAIAQRCAFLLPEVDVKQMMMPRWEFSGDTPVGEVIRAEATAGLEQRLIDFVLPQCADTAAKEAARERYMAQLDYELKMINQMGFDGYFLITSDFIRWAKQQGIPVGPGRGSGAGSVVAWALQITDLDPIRWDLYFERFLNPERISLPDFDVDFCQDRRDEVIKYVQRRFGEERVAHIITFGSLKARACLRDVGRVLGLPYNFVGQIAALIPEGANPPPIDEVLTNDERLKNRYEAEDDVRRLVDTARALEGCYRHASTHAAGVIIADRRLDEVCGLYVDPRSGLPVTQLSMKDAEYAGLVKFDFLGLKTLSVIRACEEMVRAAKEPEFKIEHVSLSDAPTFAMLKKGATCGVFQIESAGMTELTKKMQADDMEALSALIALYRPGPLGTGMVDDYVNRRLGKEAAKYPHPELEPALRDTFGVPVYQEQIMRMARDLAGYTLGGADMLRRAMGKKKPEEMAKEKAKFLVGAATHHGVEREQGEYIFGLMETFAGYGFNKAHSMAYALISYQTAYLKAHFPAEFMAATMTYDRGNHDKLLRYKLELQTLGIGFLAADVNASGVFFEVQDGAVRHALSALKGAGEEAMRALVAVRGKKPFKDVWDLLARCGPTVLNRRQLEVLMKAGALDSLEPRRDWLFANIETFLAYGMACADARNSGQQSLFGEAPDRVETGPYVSSLVAGESWDYLAKLQFEAEAVGFYVSDHPLGAFKAELQQLSGLRDCADVPELALLSEQSQERPQGGGRPARPGVACKLAGIIHGVREVKTKAGARMGIVTISDPTGQAEVVFFPELYGQVADQLVPMAAGGGPQVFSVRISMDGERLRVGADAVKPLAAMLGERAELVLRLRDSALITSVHGMLAKAERGPTTVKLIMPSAQGETVLRLPQKIGISAAMMANLRGLGVVA